MKIFKSKVMLIAILLIVAVAIGVSAFLIAGVLHGQELEQIRNEALERLEREIGQYDEQSIVLYRTSKAQAEELSELLDAELRITEDGRFAKLTLPVGKTIRDVYADDNMLEHIEKMSADYQVRVSELTEDVQEETGVRLPTRPQYFVTDYDYELQTYLDYLNMKNVWGSYTGSGVTVAVIDTGIDTDHPEFAGRISEYSYNATEDKIVKDWTDENGNYDWSLIEDEVGHGTAVTGVIAASMNNGGIVGIAPDVNIIVIKAECGQDGSFKRTSDLVFGLYYAIERDVSVVNMSFGTYDSLNPFAEASQLAYDSDILCIAAAGNDNTANLMYPAADPHVVGVGALDTDSWQRAAYSNYGDNVNLVAPGTTYTAYLDGTYRTVKGTSVSSPIVAGMLAMQTQYNAYYKTDELTNRLYASCYDLGTLGRDEMYGFGAVDMHTFLTGSFAYVTFEMLTDELDDIETMVYRGHTLQEYPEPERLYSVFDGWYYDDACTQEADYFVEKFYGDITLYAKWVNEDDGVPFTYVELEDGTIEIRSYTGKRRYITIPEKIDGKIVSSIGNSAFAGQTRLCEVVLPSGLTNIGDYAFQECHNLLRVEIPANVKTIGKYAFYDNIRLSSVWFSGESKLETIGTYAFMYCGRLESIELPSSLRSVDGTAFYGAIALSSIEVQKGNSSFVSENGVLYTASKHTVVAFPSARSGQYALPEATKTVGICAFAYAKINAIELSSVTRIEDSAFSGSGLQRVVIPDTVAEMGTAAFSKNTALAEVILGKGLSRIGAYSFLGDELLKEIIIPNTILSIDAYAFLSAGLESVYFEDGSKLAYIGQEAFAACRLTEIRIPASVSLIDVESLADNPLTNVQFAENSKLVYIGPKAFIGCGQLTSIELPERLEVIDELAFAQTGLYEVRIPSSVKTLEAGVFAYCQDLYAIYVDANNRVYQDLDGVVYTLDGKTVCAYPAGKTCIEYALESTTRNVVPYTFAGTVYLQTVTLPEGMETIGEYAFIDCGISNYFLPSTLIEIKGYAFYQNRNLSYIELPQSLVQIAEFAFSRCASLSWVSIPDNVLQIGRYAFAEDWNLGNIIFGEQSKLPRIGYGAFAYCGLYSFTVPSNVSTIAQGAFEGCERLYGITFAENSKLESLSAYMFDGCENIQSLIFMQGSALNSIQAHGLEGMIRLQHLDLTATKLTNIDNFAFRLCENLQTLTLPDTVTNVGRYAFYGCGSLSELYLPKSVEHIGSCAFLGTNNLELYMTAESMPPYLDENWDRGIRGYYTGVTEVKTEGDYKYAVLQSGSIAILQYLGDETTVDLTAVNFGAPITIIGGDAFKDSTVTSIKLPETLTTIQAGAFYSASLQSIVIPANVVFIGRDAFAQTDIGSLTFEAGAQLSVIEQYAFKNTNNLTTVTLPKTVTTMGTGVFEKSGLTSVAFEDGINLKEIPQNAFLGTKLTTVKLPDSIETVGHNAFRDIRTLKTVDFGNSGGIRLLSNVFYNTGLESLHIPKTVTYIGEYCFVGLENLTEITVDEDHPYYRCEDGLLLDKSGRKLIVVPAGKTGSLTVPAEIEVIGFGAFEKTALYEILFDENTNILTFGYRAFFGARNLTELHVPASIVSIDYYAFAYCEKLQTVTFAEGNNLKGIYEGAFCGDINLENITIPDSIVEVSDFAFYGCTKIDKLPFGENNAVKGIYDYAFAYTSIGGEFIVPEELADIGAYAFLGTDITKLTIPETNKKNLIIGIGAFEACNHLTEITLPFIGASYEDDEFTWFGYIFGAGTFEANQTYIPASLETVTITEGITFIGRGGFANCSSIKTIHVPHSISVLDLYAFDAATAEVEFTRPISLVLYSEFQKEIWNSYFSRGTRGELVIEDGPTSVEWFAFAGCDKLEKIVLPDTVTAIGSNAFFYCDRLQSVKLPPNLTVLGESAFEGCSSLTSICIPAGVSDIGQRTFFECRALSEVILPENLKQIGMYAFYQCDSLLGITLPDGTVSIEERAFESCSSLEYVDFPDNIKEIGDCAFLECGSLRSVQLPDSVLSLGYNAFCECRALTGVKLPAGLTAISNYTFANCTSLQSVQFSEGIESIGAGAFYRCESLQEIELPQQLVLIQAQAFADCSGLKSVVIPDSVTEIEYSAFDSCTQLSDIKLSTGLTTIDQSVFANCTSLSSIEIPQNISALGTSAFANCTSLVHVAFSSGLTVIGDTAFANCYSLREVELPDGLQSIGARAFANCGEIHTLVLPNGLTTIAAEAFSCCSNLTVIDLPATAVTIEPEAFSDCNNLVIIYNRGELDLVFRSSSHGGIASYACIIVDKNGDKTYADGYFSEGDFLFRSGYDGYILCMYFGDQDTITLPAEVRGVPYTIERFRGGVNIILPEGIKEIHDHAFYNNKTICSVTLPEGVTAIGNNAFVFCSNLKQINLPSGLLSIGHYAFDECNHLQTLSVPESVEEIGTYAFPTQAKVIFEGANPKFLFVGGILCDNPPTKVVYANRNIQYADIPHGVLTIDDGVFQNCDRLVSVSIPSTVTSIRNDAFSGCTALESISIPDSVTSIYSGVFASCTSLKEVVLHENITYLGSSVFAQCESLENVVLPDCDRIPSGLFSGCTNLTEIKLPDGIEAIDYGAFQNCTSLKELTIPASVTSIGGWAFRGCTSLQRIVIPEGVSVIEWYTFADCTGLTEVMIPDSILEIEYMAFLNCSSLKTITISKNIKVIEEFLFSGCTSLESVFLPSGLETIEANAFEYCESLKTIDLPEGLKTIEGWAFYGCSALEEMLIPQSVTMLGESVFFQCYGLRSVELLGSHTSIPPMMFYECRELQEVLFLDSVTSIGENAFYACTSLSRLDLPVGLLAIENGAFWNCTSLSAVKFPETLQTIDDRAFLSCGLLTELTFPEGLVSIGDSAFNGCYGIKKVVIPSSVTMIKDYAFESCYRLNFIFNNSDLDLTIGSLTHGSVAEHALAIIDRNGNVVLANGYVAEGDFIFGYDSDEYRLCAYLGDNETVILPDHFAGQQYILSGLNSAVQIKHLVISDGVKAIDGYALTDLKDLQSVSISQSVQSMGDHVFAFDNEYIYDPEAKKHGTYIVDGWLIGLDASCKYIHSVEKIKNIADFHTYELYDLKELFFPLISSNIETLHVIDLKGIIPYTHTLKNVVIHDTADISDLGYYPDMFGELSGVTIYIEMLEQDLNWDDNFPGWNHDNLVIYGDQWSWVTFYDENGGVLSRTLQRHHEIIRRPVYEPNDNAQYSYNLIGWDLDGDGIADSIPATTATELELRPIIKKTVRQYNVTFADQNGTIYHSETLPYGAEITLPANPAKQGHDFEGWAEFIEGMTVTGNVAFYAEWKHHGEGHVYAEPVWVDPTCTEQGYYKHTCTVCGEYYGTDYTDALGHEYQTSIIVPTCSTYGYVLHTCSKCGDTYQTNKTELLQHSYGEWIIDQTASCTEEGAKHRFCTACNAREDAFIPAIGHAYVGEVTDAPTCERVGTMLYTCTACGGQATDKISAIPHSYEKRFASQTWLGLVKESLQNLLYGYEDEQAYYYACASCGNLCTVEETGSIGAGIQSASCEHVLSDWTEYIAATCVGNNVKAKFCELCKKPIELRIGTETGDHNHVDGICTVCGDIAFTYGDANGDGKIDGRDVTRMLRYIANYNEETETSTVEITLGADANGDGTINGKDVTRLLRYIANYDETTGESSILLGPSN